MCSAMFRNEQMAGNSQMAGAEQGIGNERRASNDPQRLSSAQPLSPYKSLSDRTIPLAALKTTEMELQKRWHHRLDNFFPLWFHAHTERNIYLWRHGLSIGDESLFEFWVDVPALIQKRENKLTLDANDSPEARAAQRQSNPLTNPNWSTENHAFATPLSDMAILIDEERRYLKDLDTTLAKLTPHIHALSVATTMIHQQEVEVVVLPFKIARQ